MDENQILEKINRIDMLQKEVETLKARNFSDPALIKSVEDIAKAVTAVQKDADDWKKKSLIIADENQRVMRPGQYVSDACAKWLVAIGIRALESMEKINTHPQRETLLKFAADTLGLEKRSTLTTTDIPMPTDYGQQVVELVWKYGQARQYATMYPLGTITVKLPYLKTTPKFGPISTAATVTEKSPQFDWVTFTAVKYGGLVRFPSEIDADSIVPLGNFLARYIAREMARVEDANYWAADASGNWAPAGTNLITGLQAGLGAQCVTNSKYIQLGGGKTATSDITLNDLRLLRAQVNTAVFQGGGGAYYMNPTMEALLVTFNTIGQPLVYIRNGQSATLDGFQIRWVDVLPTYSTTPNASNIPVIFGDASYHYFGMRQGMEVLQSRDVFFATDEIALRALERFATGLMASDACAAIQLAAA